LELIDVAPFDLFLLNDNASVVEAGADLSRGRVFFAEGGQRDLLMKAKMLLQTSASLPLHSGNPDPGGTGGTPGG
jgi:hypothetical protein